MRILITGATGTIGRVLMQCLKKRYDVIGVDKKTGPGVKKLDFIKQPKQFKDILRGIDVVVHLAWNIKGDGTSLGPVLDANKKMGKLVYEAALEMKVPRVVFASSVQAAFGHVKGYPKFIKKHSMWHRKRKIKVSDGSYPIGIYGASKVYLEALGKAYSAKGLKVIAVRFGAVTPDNSFGEYPVWLSHRDCCQFIEKCCIVKKLPAFSTFFAISDNACNPFDISEARRYLGYKPQDGTVCLSE